MSIKAAKAFLLCIILLFVLLTSIAQVHAWSNGGYSDNPSNPDYGTHDWIAEHALDWLPAIEKEYIVANLAMYLYGTELPDNPTAEDGIGDTANHHIYFASDGTLINDSAAVRAQEEYHQALSYSNSNNLAMAAKIVGIMSHYIADMAVFGHVMGSTTDWGAEVHHSDYESYVNTRTNSYSDDFNIYLSFDGSLDRILAYDAAINLAYDTTFDVDGVLTCVWMDTNYDWSNPTFKDRCGESLNLAVNYLTDVLHTLYLESGEVSKASSSITCSVSETTMLIREALTVSGTIFPSHADVAVTLTYTRPDGSTIKRTVTTATDGSFKDTYTPDVAGSWSVEASWAGDWDHEGAASPSTFFTVKETVKFPPKASFTHSPATNLSVIVTINFEDTSADPDGTIVSWLWDFGDNVTSNDQNPAHKYGDKGTYTVKLTVTDSDGLTDTKTKEITILNLPPTAEFTYSPENPTVGQKVNFTDRSEDPERKTLSYSWDFDDGLTSTEKNPSHKYEEPGAYTVKLTVTDDEGAKGTRPITITVTKLSSAITCSISSSEITEDDSITVSGAISPILSEKTVILTYKKPDGSTHNRTVTTGSEGTYRDSYAPDATGDWAVTASWTGDSIHEGASSLPNSFTVREKPFIETPLGIATIYGVIIATVVIIAIAILKKRTG